ncbi:phage virion morphogenesis protein [Thiothrix nivea]|uniref:Phage virion morphogenesis protein n=1 Tax=Thiothrix nivea (strain ATCC 35100 / DSM 5205 / JP2) TaxID=870187 RepID=A0A656HB50_THINJ|nr:phage virion morphogenesis protein [Thiothrix nivea]EIJ33322.1 phage virion morphogenesis protein [Thiothrix nivea DSM 5205]
MGAVIAIDIDTSSLQEGFNRLLTAVQDLTPVMQAIGLKLVENTQERFLSNVSPDGDKWKERKYETDDTKGRKILTGHGPHLRNSITYRASAHQVEVGTNLVYAAIHQFGGKTSPHKIAAKRGKSLAFGVNPNAKKKGDPWLVKSVNHPGSKMPARPFLGLSADDEQDIMDIIETHIERATP